MHLKPEPPLHIEQVEDLKEALQGMFKTAGVKGSPLLFLMTDGQIVNERFLIYINDILSNGWISDLFPKVKRCCGACRKNPPRCYICPSVIAAVGTRTNTTTRREIRKTKR